MGCVHTGTEKNQAVGSKTGPEIGRYGKVNQKLERYDIVPFRSRVNRTVRYRTAFLTCLVSMGDTKLVSITISDVEVEIRPLIVSSFQDLHRLFILILIN